MPIMRASWRPKIETPPVPCNNTVWPPTSFACSIMAFQTVTPAQGRVAPSSSDKCAGIFTTPLQHRIFRKHAVDAAAKCACVDIGKRLATGPALKEAPADAVADLHASDTGTDLNDFPR